MGTVSELPRGVHVGIRAFALESGIDRDTIRKRIDAAALKPSGKSGRHPVYRLKDLLKAVLQANESGREDPDSYEPFKRQAHYKAEHLKLQLETDQRDVIPRIEVEQEQARFFKVVAMNYDTLPDILERDCGLPAHVVELIEKTLDKSRDELYKALADGPEEEAEPAEA